MSQNLITTLCLLVGMTAAGARAHAFETKHTTSGANVRWNGSRAEFYVEPTGSEAKDELLDEALRGAANAWRAGAGFDVRAVRHSNPRDPVSVIRWAEGDWSQDHSRLSVTFVSFESRSGRITSAEIIINDADYTWADRMTAPDGWDLQNTITHELGHAIGLEHSSVESATMFAQTRSSETSKRDLDADDISGVAALYADTAMVAAISAEMVPLDCSTHGRKRSFWSFFALLGLLLPWTLRSLNYRETSYISTR
jgi:hypothetical protein